MKNYRISEHRNVYSELFGIEEKTQEFEQEQQDKAKILLQFIEEATPAEKEQTDCRSDVGAHSDLQAGRGAHHAEDGLCTAGNSSFIRVQPSIRRFIRKEPDVERSGSFG